MHAAAALVEEELCAVSTLSLLFVTLCAAAAERRSLAKCPQHQHAACRVCCGKDPSPAPLSTTGVILLWVALGTASLTELAGTGQPAAAVLAGGLLVVLLLYHQVAVHSNQAVVLLLLFIKPAAPAAYGLQHMHVCALDAFTFPQQQRCCVAPVTACMCGCIFEASIDCCLQGGCCLEEYPECCFLHGGCRLVAEGLCLLKQHGNQQAVQVHD
jgi:hypothetical protein